MAPRRRNSLVRAGLIALCIMLALVVSYAALFIAVDRGVAETIAAFNAWRLGEEAGNSAAAALFMRYLPFGLLAACGSALVFLMGQRVAVQRLVRAAAVQAQRRLTDPETPRRRAEDREARLQVILDRMGEGLVTFNEHGRIDFVNPAVEKMFKAQSADLIGATITRLIPQDKRDLLKILAAKPPVSGAAINLEAEGRRQNGDFFPLEITLTEYRFAGSRMFAGLFRDVSERKSAETRVLEAEAQLREAIEFLPDAFVLYDANDRLVICNERYRELYATSADLLRPGEAFETIIREGVARGQYRDSRNDPQRWIAERIAMHRNPPARPIEQHLDDGRWLRVFERRTPDGRTVGFRIDITELKERQEALESSEGRLRAIVLSALDAIVILDENCNVVDFNPAAERITGFTKAEMLGQSIIGTLVPVRHRDEARARFNRILSREKSSETGYRIHARARRKDGSEFLSEISMNVASGQNGKLLIAFVRDVTQERAKAVALQEAKLRAEDASRAKANFLAMMSHEIRTPLNAVMGILDLLRDSPLNAAQQHYVRTATESATALLNILNDILDLTRLEARRLDFTAKPFFVRALLFGVRDLFAARAQEKALTFSVEIADEVPLRLVGDVGRIRQVLINLVGNAIKFTAQGSVRLTVEAMKIEAERASLRFLVIDTGPGIPEAFADQAFQKFTTLDDPGPGATDGVGLGLAICRELVEGMGGSIELQSEPGQGCRFFFDLDLAIASAESEEEDEPRLDGEELKSIAGARILLAEDNATNRMVTVDMLQRWGCRVEAVADGEQVLRKLDEESYDVLLMDVSMPVMDGVQTTKAIRARGDAASRLPIIALTAHALIEERDRVLDAGMSDFLTKPINQGELLHHLSQAIEAGGTRSEGGGALVRVSETRELPLIDGAVLQDVLDSMSEEKRARVLEQLEKDLEMKAEEFLTAHDDLGKVERASHVLSSLAGTFGASELFALSDKVNRAAMAGDPSALDEIGRLVSLIERTTAALHRAVAVKEKSGGNGDKLPGKLRAM